MVYDWVDHITLDDDDDDDDDDDASGHQWSHWNSGHTGKMKRSRQPFSAAFLLRKIQFFSGSNPQFQTWLKGISAGPSCCISMQQKEETAMTNGFSIFHRNH